MTPTPWIGVLLMLGTFRLVRLAGWDDLTIPLRRKLTGMGDQEHKDWAHWIDQELEAGRDPWNMPVDELPPVSPRGYYFSKMIRCAWCFGFWASLTVYVMWLAAPSVTIFVAIPFAISAVVGLVARNLD